MGGEGVRDKAESRDSVGGDGEANENSKGERFDQFLPCETWQV
jgi:hypothetical protein